ncbi:hypothetical protein [Streptacidiphilus pinicola]|nr:hypothetical protein [Streptacidiphilus pinicola]
MFEDSTPASMPTPLLFVVAFGVAAVASVVVGALATPKHAVVGLVLVGVACAAVARRGRNLGAALVIAPVFWLCYDGFVEHRDGVLGWGGWTETWRLAVLLAAAALPLLVRGVRRLWSARTRFRRGSLEWFEPEMPERGHPSAWN